MNKNTTALIILSGTIIVGVLGVGMALWKMMDDAWAETTQQTAPVTSTEGQIQVRLTSDGNTIELQSDIPEKATVFEVLKNLEQSEKLTMGYRQTPLGPFIEALNNTNNDESQQKYWFLYINNQSATQGADATYVQAGDIIDWKLEQAQ